MSKVLHSRLFRFLVCFLVICCILVNCSPIRAEATAIVATALTLEGLLALLFSMALGVVAVDLTAETINRIGTDMEETIITQVDTSELQKWNNLKKYYEKINPDNNGPDDPLEWTKLLKQALAGGLLTAITGWLVSLVNAGEYEFDGDSVPDGWAFYNGILLPSIEVTFPDYTHYVVTYDSYYRVYLANGPIYYDESLEKFVTDGPLTVRKCTYFGNTEWGSGTGNTTYDSDGNNIAALYLPIVLSDMVWSNYDIYEDKYKQYVIFEGSEPKYKYSEVITPIYVGDIPTKIQNGELDEDDITLPVIDPFKLIKTPNSAADQVNQMQQALKDGTITIDDYLKQVEVQDDTDTEDPTEAPTEDPSEVTDPTVAVDPWEPPEDPGQFALDLSEVFPFCIPFDLYDFLSLLNADPVAPVIDWEIALPGGGSYPLQIDLSAFDSVAQLLRRLELLLFIVALGIKTRDLIKG